MFRDYTKYEVYDDGRIWSYSHNKWLKPQTTKDGYQRVFLTDNEGNSKWYFIHRVVWESVTGEPIPEGYEINHRNEIKTSNMISNLELLTHKENMNYGSRNARASKSNTNNPKRSKAMTNNPKISKAVGAFKDGKLIFTFQSTQEAGRNGFKQSNVSACCNGKLKHHKGFEWRYIYLSSSSSSITSHK